MFIIAITCLQFGLMSMMYTNLPLGLLQYLFIHIIQHIFPPNIKRNQKYCKVMIGGLVSTRVELFALLFLE